MRGERGEITKIIFKGMLIAGAVAVASTSPYFISRALPELVRYFSCKKNRREKETKLYNSFYYLKKNGFLDFEYKGKQLYVSLSKEGRKKANNFLFNGLRISKPKRWDKKWRVLIFDIQNKHKIKREALRGKIKELGFFQLQKSVWVYPYDFKNEVCAIRNFFNFDNNEMKIITACEIENDKEIKTYFNIL